LPKIKIFGVTVMLVIAAYISQARADAMADANAHLAAFKAESNAKMEAARASQVARFKAHPEQLKDPNCCDMDKFNGNNANWTSIIACNEVSGLNAERERLRDQVAKWRASECTDLEDCRKHVRDLKEGIESIRMHRADAKLNAGEQSFEFHLIPEPYPPCAITGLACSVNPELSEAFSEIDQYYRKLLRESDERLNEARKLLQKKKEQDDYEDQLLDRY
jgi:hypothetical protein